MNKKEPEAWIDGYHKRIEAYLSSQGCKKMWNYFLAITKTDYFLQTIGELRKKYNIPPEGFKPKDKYYVFPPSGFSFEDFMKLGDEIRDKICKKYKLHGFDYGEVIQEYVYYGFLHPISQLNACGLFYTYDFILDKEEPFGEMVQESDDMAYPIAIRMSPYATQRDLINYIKTVWDDEIDFLRKKYTDPNIKIGKIKFRKPQIQERNDFIYKNRNLPIKRIRKLLALQKIYLDDGHIGKVISLEKKRRKEV
ncbi:MAG: hypothetical protein WCT22_04200 [Patescibacteria group bacterium]|jgi:hypothetical protein